MTGRIGQFELVKLLANEILMNIIADENIPFVAKCFASLGDVQALSGRGITPEIAGKADILLVRSITPVNEKLLSNSKVKFVATATIGYEHVDVDYLKKRNIGFASAPGSNANSASEYVITALLEIGQMHKISLEGKSIGIIGVGNVGSRVVNKCHSLGMKVLLNDPPLQRQTGDSKYRPLDELYDCDFITLHTPLTLAGDDKTYHLANEDFFKSLKNGCVFVNASRGGVVDSDALKDAISKHQLQAIALDVWENEPNIDIELLELVDIGTPHIAGYSLDGKIAGMIMIYKSICEYFNVEPKFDIADFLPEPDVKTIELNENIKSRQDSISAIVQNIYPIERDNRRLRQILDEPAKNRGKFFDELRKNYPIRREFQNTEVVVRKTDFNIAEKLRGIGFEVTI